LDKTNVFEGEMGPAVSVRGAALVASAKEPGRFLAQLSARAQATGTVFLDLVPFFWCESVTWIKNLVTSEKSKYKRSGEDPV